MVIVHRRLLVTLVQRISLSTNPVSYAIALAVPVVSVNGASPAFPVRRIYCVGRNYVEHIREMKEGDERDPPFFFQKPSDAIIADGAELAYPPCTDDFQHEIELVVAIGKDGSDITVSEAPGHVFGYAIGIDMTRRDRQREARERMLPWETGKSFDESAPCGALHPVEQVGHPGKGSISLSVNGVVRQKGDLSQMIWNVPEIIANLSTQYALKAGDLIFTGTPAGVGPVKPGDRIEGQIEGLGAIHFTIGTTRK
jgi:fumarylpyruvate hydrolase